MTTPAPDSDDLNERLARIDDAEQAALNGMGIITGPTPAQLQRDERTWTPYGFVTPAEAEVAAEWERTARDLCACSHMRQEHFPDRCAHVASGRSSSGIVRLTCPCSGWEAPESGPSATQSAEHASGDHRDSPTTPWSTGGQP